MYASDGYSGKLVSFASMMVKNNSAIYKDVYRGWLLSTSKDGH